MTRKPVASLSRAAILVGVSLAAATTGQDRSVGRIDEKGRKQGPWVETVGEMGWQRLEGNYRDGLRDGIWRVYGARQMLYREESFEAGRKDGPCLYYSADGRVRALVNCREGKRHGTARFYYRDGRSLLVLYRHGQEMSRRLVAADGKLIRELLVRKKHPSCVSRHLGLFCASSPWGQDIPDTLKRYFPGHPGENTTSSRAPRYERPFNRVASPSATRLDAVSRIQSVGENRPPVAFWYFCNRSSQFQLTVMPMRKRRRREIGSP